MPTNMTFEVILHPYRHLSPTLHYTTMISEIKVVLVENSLRQHPPTFNPCRTSSYASVLRSMQFNVRPFIAKVSENHEGNRKHKCIDIKIQIKKKI